MSCIATLLTGIEIDMTEKKLAWNFRRVILNDGYSYSQIFST